MKAKSFLQTTIVISAFLAQLTFASLPRYEIIDLGPGIANGINQAGQVVGIYWSATGVLAFMWDKSAGIKELGTLGGPWSDATAINDVAQVVGCSRTLSGQNHAFLWDKTSGIIDLGTLPGYAHSQAWGINNVGQVVGDSGDTAFLWEDDKMIDLGTLGGSSSYALAINNIGHVVGGSASNEGFHAFIWDRFKGMRDLGVLPSSYSNYSIANSINDCGQIVGISGGENVFLWENGEMIDLGTLEQFSESCTINDLGQVVGAVEYEEGEYYAFYWERSIGMITLDEILSTDSGWRTLCKAKDINNRGQIVGFGITEKGEEHAFLMTPIPPKIIYVDDDATGANNGSSWADAYNYLQDALADANSSPKPLEIRVAQGIYTPDRGAGITPGDQTATFQFINGVSIIGGFAGFGEPDPNARDIETYEIILSGDLNGNDIKVADPCDLLTEPTRAENSYNVVTGSGTDASAVLDGFTITGGNANGPVEWPFVHRRGGGMYNESGSPILTNCTLRKNSSAWGGGGTYNRGYEGVCKPIFTNCTFTENWADGGGGMENRHSSVILTNCTFSCNSAGYGGGGMQAGFADVLINCTFRGNSAVAGGGMVNDSGNIALINCTFAGNSAVYYGGAMFNEESSLTLTNCTLSGNSAPDGGGMYNYNSDEVALSNCILTGNKNSAIVAGEHTAFLTMTNCTFTGNDCAVDPGCYAIVTMTNCILWDGGNEICFYDPWVLTITHSDVQGGWWGNIDADPCFADPGYWDANGVWIEGDYHLLPDSPCIDAGDPNYIAEPNETDLDGRPRVIASRIDMGAYEYSPPISAAVRIVPRTINLQSKGKWIAAYIQLPEDYNVTDIDPNRIFLEDEIHPDEFSVDEQQQVATARFSREDVQAILGTGDIELTITGQLTDGKIFEGKDTIKVIDKAAKN